MTDSGEQSVDLDETTTSVTSPSKKKKLSPEEIQRKKALQREEQDKTTWRGRITKFKYAPTTKKLKKGEKRPKPEKYIDVPRLIYEAQLAVANPDIDEQTLSDIFQEVEKHTRKYEKSRERNRRDFAQASDDLAVVKANSAQLLKMKQKLRKSYLKIKDQKADQAAAKAGEFGGDLSDYDIALEILQEETAKLREDVSFLSEYFAHAEEEEEEENGDVMVADQDIQVSQSDNTNQESLPSEVYVADQDIQVGSSSLVTESDDLY